MPTTKSADPAERSQRGMREWLKELCCWAVCDNVACRRGRACRGDTRACARVNFARLPQGVQDWCAAFLTAKTVGVSFDEAMVWLDEEGLNDAYTQWVEAAHGGRGAGAPLAPPGVGAGAEP